MCVAYTVKAMSASMLTMAHLKGAGQSSGFSGSPLGSKSTMVVSSAAMSAPSWRGSGGAGSVYTWCPSFVMLRSSGCDSSVPRVILFCVKKKTNQKKKTCPSFNPFRSLPGGESFL